MAFLGQQVSPNEAGQGHGSKNLQTVPKLFFASICLLKKDECSQQDDFSFYFMFRLDVFCFFPETNPEVTARPGAA